MCVLTVFSFNFQLHMVLGMNYCSNSSLWTEEMTHVRLPPNTLAFVCPNLLHVVWTYWNAQTNSRKTLVHQPFMCVLTVFGFNFQLHMVLGMNYCSNSSLWTEEMTHVRLPPNTLAFVCPNLPHVVWTHWNAWTNSCKTLVHEPFMWKRDTCEAL